MTDARVKFEHILTEKIPDLKDKRIFIWGTGNTAELYREGLERLEKERLVICAYCDNNSDKWGKTFAQKPIISPDELQKEENACVLICSPQKKVVDAVGEQLSSMGLKWYHIDEFILKNHAKEVLECYDLLDDEESKKVYAEVVQCRMSGTYPALSFVCDKQYFGVRPFMGKNPKEVFLDCGAFVGDSIERYLWERDGGFAKIIAFEPDSGNFKAMKKRVARLKSEWNIKEDKIMLFPYGVGEKSVAGKIVKNDANNGLGSKIVQAGCDLDEEVQIVSLDEFVKEPVTFLKADIESYEYKMLMGARQLILRDKPIIAVCIYHNAVDLYSIPLLLKDLLPEYKMAVRHHSVEMDDTVLYAWIEQ